MDGMGWQRWDEGVALIAQIHPVPQQQTHRVTPAPPEFPVFQDIGAGLGTFLSPAGPDMGKGKAVQWPGCPAGHCLPMRNSPRTEPALPVIPEKIITELGRKQMTLQSHLAIPEGYLLFSFRSKIQTDANQIPFFLLVSTTVSSDM